MNPVGPRNAAWAVPRGRSSLNDALPYSPVVLFGPVLSTGRSIGDALCAACDGGGRGFLQNDSKRAVPAPFGHAGILLAMQGDHAIKSPEPGRPNPALRDAAALQVAPQGRHRGRVWAHAVAPVPRDIRRPEQGAWADRRRVCRHPHGRLWGDGTLDCARDGVRRGIRGAAP